MRAETVPDGSITSAKLAPSSVASAALGDSVALGATNVNGRLDIYRTSVNTPAISLVGVDNQISTFGDSGREHVRLWGPAYGELLLYNGLTNNATAVDLSANASGGGFLALRNTNGSNRAVLSGGNSGGTLTLNQADGQIGISILGDSGGAGLVSVRSTNGSTRASLDGSDNGGGSMRLFESDGTETVTATAEGNGALVVRQGDGSTGVGVYASNGTGGGGVTIYRDDGTFAGQLTVANATQDDGYLGLANRAGSTRFYARASNGSDSQGGYVGIRNSAGVQTITLDASDAAGDGKITTQVLQITGGSDLSENFEINAGKDTLEPGMIVSIDSKKAGELVLCQTAFDKKVAGVISGAGGVKTGMLMGQAGTKADGKHPVALTGRVYCRVDADAGGAVEAGDLITTSNTPGHGMKVSNHSLASGAIIGKAMSPLEKGKGLVLVLVTLQ